MGKKKRKYDKESVKYLTKLFGDQACYKEIKKFRKEYGCKG